MCEKSKVIGMSATATVPTVIGNFDLEYLANKLGSNYHTVSGEDFSRLIKEFTESQSGYDNVKIHSELIGTSGYSVRTWENIVSDKGIVGMIYDKLDIAVNEQDNSYYKELYARIAMAFRKFLKHDGIRSFLCFLTRYPVGNDRKLDKNLLYEIFGNYATKFKPEEYIMSPAVWNSIYTGALGEVGCKLAIIANIIADKKYKMEQYEKSRGCGIYNCQSGENFRTVRQNHITVAS